MSEAGTGFQHSAVNGDTEIASALPRNDLIIIVTAKSRRHKAVSVLWYRQSVDLAQARDFGYMLMADC